MRVLTLNFILTVFAIGACDNTVDVPSKEDNDNNYVVEEPIPDRWMVSKTMTGAYHQYYDVPAWNSNGSMLILRMHSSRDLYMVSSINGLATKVNVHNAMGRNGDNYVQWDRNDPEMFYYVAYNLSNKTGTSLVKQKLSGEIEVRFIDDNELRLGVGKSYNSIVYSLKDHSTQSVKMPGPVHRVRFTKHPDLSIFCNLRNVPNGGSWITTIDGVSTKFWASSAGHPDWSPDGERMSFFNSGFHVINRQGNILKYLRGPNGHQSWSYDGSLIFIDMNNDNGRIHGGHITSIDPVTLELTPIVAHHSIYTSDQASHPHVYSSPDGTKVVFNSINKSESNPPHVYVTQVKKPKGVIDLQMVNVADGSINLTWKMPESKEIGSVIIYSVHEGEKRKKVSEVEGESWTGKKDPSAQAYEAVTMERFGVAGEAVRVVVE